MAGEQFVLSARDETRAVFDGVKRNIEGVERAAAGIRGAFGALTGVLTAGAFAGFVRGGIDAADALDDLSEKLGITVENLSALQYAGKVSGTSAEQLGDGLRKLSINLQAGASGSKEMQTAFAALGISAGELGRLKTDEALARIATQFAEMENGAGKTALAVKLFGKSGADMIPVLNLGADGLARMGVEARQFGAVVGTEAAAAAARFNDNLARLQAGVQGFGSAIAAQVSGPLANMLEQLLESQRIFGGFASALYNIGLGVDPFKSLGENLTKYRAEVERLTKLLANPDIKGTKLQASLQDSLDTATKRLEFLKFQQRQQIATGDASSRDARDLALASGGRPRAAPILADAAAASRASSRRLAADGGGGGQDMVDRYNDAEFIRRLDEVARERAEREAEIIRGIGVGPEAVQRAMDARESKLQGLLGQTKTGQRDAVYADLKLLNSAFDAGTISADQLGEAYGNLTARLEEIDRGAKSVAAITIKPFADDTASQLRDLESAVRGFGNKFTDSIVEAFSKGRLEGGKILSAIAQDVARMLIQRSITAPLFNYIGGALQNGLGALFSGGGGATPDVRAPVANTQPAIIYGYGGGKASGGPVSSGMAYTVGEVGPELFIPRTSGTIVPNNALGGQRITQVFNIAAGVDAGLVQRAASLGAAMAQSNIARSARIGAMG